MALSYEGALSRLAGLISWGERQNSQFNEATTRLQAIDVLFFDCLGWDRDEARLEGYRDGEYTDYELGPRPFQVVVEAKRSGFYFSLPAGTAAGVAGLPSLTKGNAALQAAVTQVSSYCQRRGIPIAVVTNGHQLVAFLGARTDGTAPEEGKALIFPSHKAIETNFRQLWDNLSPYGIDATTLLRTVGGPNVNPAPPKLAERLPEYPKIRPRSALQTDLEVVGGLLLEDLARAATFDRSFVEACYCPSGALAQYAQVSRAILKSRYAYEEQQGVTTKSVGLKQGRQAPLTAEITLAAANRRPIILLGPVGVGKTMFIRHLVAVDAEQELTNAIVLYLDLGSSPVLSGDLETHISSQIEQQLLVSYQIDIADDGFVRAAYFGELQRFENSIYGGLKESDPAEYRRQEISLLERKLADRESHLHAALAHIAHGRKQPIVIFLDNIDQRPFEFQERLFLTAVGMAENWPSTVFVALRPDTFHRSRREGTLTAYQPRVFTVDPPRIEQVLAKRIDFAIDELRVHGRLPTFPEGLEIKSNTMDLYMQVLRFALVENAEIAEFVENVSDGNVRVALEMLGRFMGSPNVDAAKILRIREETGKYRIPLHEFARSALWGDYEHFDPVSSPVANLYDVGTADPREHFLTPALLGYVDLRGRELGTAGYVPADEVSDFLQGWGYQPSQITDHLRRARSHRLVEQTTSSTASLGGEYRSTACGTYILKRLSRFFTYVDAIAVDTPIVDPAVRAEIRDVREIGERLDRADRVVAYLDRSWGETGLGQGVQGRAYDWRETQQALERDIAHVGNLVDPARWGEAFRMHLAADRPRRGRRRPEAG